MFRPPSFRPKQCRGGAGMPSFGRGDPTRCRNCSPLPTGSPRTTGRARAAAGAGGAEEEAAWAAGPRCACARGTYIPLPYCLLVFVVLHPPFSGVSVPRPYCRLPRLSGKSGISHPPDLKLSARCFLFSKGSVRGAVAAEAGRERCGAPRMGRDEDMSAGEGWRLCLISICRTHRQVCVNSLFHAYQLRSFGGTYVACFFSPSGCVGNRLIRVILPPAGCCIVAKLPSRSSWRTLPIYFPLFCNYRLSFEVAVFVKVLSLFSPRP